MGSYLLQRFFGLIAVLFIALSLTFVLLRMAKGGPFDGERDLSAEKIHEREVQLKLDGSIPSQLWRWWGDVLQGDFRMSTRAKQFSVREILAQSLPVSLTLGGAAFLLASFGGVAWGAWAASRQRQWGDRIAMGTALLAISLPTFVTGPLLVLGVALGLGWLPVGGWASAKHAILPAVCLAIPYAAYVARLMRNSMAEVLQSDFIRTARAKGLPERQVIWKHALKVAILPVVSYLGPLAANLLTGSVVVESVFAVPGAGQHFVNAIMNRDPFLLLGAVAIYCTLLVVFNFAVDLAYCVLDRRIKLHA